MFRRSIKCALAIITVGILLVSCALYTQYQLDSEYGPEKTRSRYIAASTQALEFYQDIKPIVDRRCVVCHGCYDSPCQLKLEAFEGIERGASKATVYDGERLLAAEPTRLLIDASSVKQWRQKDFYPVLNERAQTPDANLAGSVLYRMLALKRQNPASEHKILPDSFDFRLHRNQQCPTIEEFDQFEEQFPLWGMPYGMPALQEQEFQLIKRWLSTGAKAAVQPALDQTHRPWVDKWEAFFNGDSYQQQLMGRYIYEHLFAANLYFKNTDDTTASTLFFKLQRSKTPPGEPIELIATRRPYDDPGVARVYYRLVRIKNTISAKIHMPYGLDDNKLQRWRELFLQQNYSIDMLPGYEPKVAANPFITFKGLPVKSRYKFMLDEAHFTIMGFIKGPVCRGQVAINVINDHFWVLFINPDSEASQSTAEFLAKENKHLRLPSELQSNVIPMEGWLRYSLTHKRYLQAKREHLDKMFPSNDDITLDVIWDGDGVNPNAALTVFRHFDSASVIQGMYGSTPKTAWLIDYPLLERIHYLLVSGFDVYGNIGHQLETRLYMDFLRMEGEFNFLTLLPDADREREIKWWYRDAESKVKRYVESMRKRGATTLGIHYETQDPKKELFDRVRKKFGVVVVPGDEINRGDNKSPSPLLLQLQRLAAVKGDVLSVMPEVSLLRVGSGSEDDRLYSLIVNRAHTNVSQLFNEKERLVPAEHTLTVLEGVIGAYPNMFFQLESNQIAQFTDAISRLGSEKGYEQLLDRYGIRRTHQEFWNFSDWAHRHYKKNDPIAAGLMDYNRFENR